MGRYQLPDCLVVILTSVAEATQISNVTNILRVEADAPMSPNSLPTSINASGQHPAMQPCWLCASALNWCRTARHTFQDVKEKVLPAEPILKLRSRMPGRLRKLVCCAPPNTRCSYTCTSTHLLYSVFPYHTYACEEVV